MNWLARAPMHPQPTPYADLNAILRELVARVQAALGTNFIGAYLHGSFAIGDFDLSSDVDFLVVIEEDIADAGLPILQALHGDIFELRCPWAQHLEGSYIPKAALKQPPPPRKFLYLDHGSRQLVRSDHDDSLVVYWVLREKGIKLIGPEPRSLVAPVSADALRQEVLETMRAWREQWLADPATLNNRFYQPFAVLSYCRMLHTLQTGAVESKAAGAAWAREALDHRWHPLIRRALDDRAGDAAWKARQQARPADLEGTWAFMQFALECAGLAPKQP